MDSRMQGLLPPEKDVTCGSARRWCLSENRRDQETGQGVHREKKEEPLQQTAGRRRCSSHERRSRGHAEWKIFGYCNRLWKMTVVVDEALGKPHRSGYALVLLMPIREGSHAWEHYPDRSVGAGTASTAGGRGDGYTRGVISRGGSGANSHRFQACSIRTPPRARGRARGHMPAHGKPGVVSPAWSWRGARRARVKGSPRSLSFRESSLD